MTPRGRSSETRSGGLIRWPVLFSACVVIFFLVGVSTVRETYQEWKVDQEIEGLQAQVGQLEGKRSHLLETIQQLQSADALDREARTRLGMRKPGERVIMVRGLPDQQAYTWHEDVTQVTSTTAVATQSDPGSNPKRWFRYFFHFTLPTT